MEKEQVKLFREKSLEAIESPESLNDYLKVTTPGVWLILSTVIVLLIGGILWGIFGRIDTRLNIAVISEGEKTVCYVPYDSLMAVVGKGSVELDGEEIALKLEDGIDTLILRDTLDPRIRIAGGLNTGDMVAQVTLDSQLPAGVYSAEVVTESLQPISLLLQ